MPWHHNMLCYFPNEDQTLFLFTKQSTPIPPRSSLALIISIAKCRNKGQFLERQDKKALHVFPADFCTTRGFHTEILTLYMVSPDSLSRCHITSVGNPIMEIRLSYLHNGISYTGKMASLFWINPFFDNKQEIYFLSLLNREMAHII